MNWKDTCYSYHIFTFPFKWERREENEKLLFEDKVDLTKIKLSEKSHWVRKFEPHNEQERTELFNEKNYFYPFVHEALYDSGKDDSLVRHYVRKECEKGTGLKYRIGVLGGTVYELDINSISLNLYSTGVGLLSFFTVNNKRDKIEEVMEINSLGRRISVPFFDLENGLTGTKESGMLPDFIEIIGSWDAYPLKEDFSSFTADSSWELAGHIKALLKDFIGINNLDIKPIIDDRMFVNSWIGENGLSIRIRENKDWATEADDWWYRIVFLDSTFTSCQNDEMKKELLKSATYSRWQKEGKLYGCSRYSLVALMSNDELHKKVFLTHMRTMYCRIAELCIVQRGSMLRFSEVVTDISKLNESDVEKMSKRVSSLFKEYIRFVNKVYFREITGADQGIELYKMMQKQMDIEVHVKNLEQEIQELHHYVGILESREEQKKLTIITIAGAMFVVPSFVIGYYGMDFNTVTESMGICMFNLLLTCLVLALGLAVWIRIKLIRIVLLFIAFTLFIKLIFF